MYKAIKGYEGIYKINELGQVRSIDRIVEYKNGSIREYKGKELKPRVYKSGYAIVTLNKNGVAKTCSVHRLVAETFLPNPDNLTEVHHLNHDRNDNRAENLQWVTRAEQIDDHLKAALGTSLRVVGHGIDKIFISSRAVKQELGIDNSAALKVAKGMYKQIKGYRIYFVDQETETNNA